MFENMIIGMLYGFSVGMIFGLTQALLMRDGIWPFVWAWMILAFGTIGWIIGAFS